MSALLTTKHFGQVRVVIYFLLIELLTYYNVRLKALPFRACLEGILLKLLTSDFIPTS
jgi:hypothetical protein